MVGIWVSENQEINSHYLSLPEKGGNHVLSYIKAVIVEPTPVDQGAFSPWEFNQCAVSLPNVD